MERKKSDKSHVDVIISVLACATVILLTCIAAAISHCHMHELAIRHGERGTAVAVANASSASAG